MTSSACYISRVRIWLIVPGLCLAACLTTRQSVLVAREPDARLDRIITQLWADDIRKHAQDGDWILSRSYFAIADVLGTVVPGTALSHASVVDAERGTIIETIDAGTRELSFEELLTRNHYAFLVRPRNVTPDRRLASVYYARSLMGGTFDTTGMLGFEDPDKFYCTEIAYWAVGLGHKKVDHWIITPAYLLEISDVIYESGPRSDPKMRARAQAELDANTEVAQRAARPWPFLAQLPIRKPPTP